MAGRGKFGASSSETENEAEWKKTREDHEERLRRSDVKFAAKEANGKTLALLSQFNRGLRCAYCKGEHQTTILIPIILSNRPGYACKTCFKNFVL